MKGDFKLKTVMDKGYFIYIIMGLAFIGILGKFIIGMVYDGLIKETENIPSSKNRLMKQIKLKFENCYKLNLGVNNIELFVDKYLYKYRQCGISMNQWKNLTKEIIFICLVLNLGGAAYELASGRDFRIIVWNLMLGLGVICLLLLTEQVVDLRHKQEVIKVNIIDYLENSLVNRLNHEYAAKIANFVPEEELTAAEDEKDEEGAAPNTDIAYMKERLHQIEGERDAGKQGISKEDQEIIQDILKEFLA